ncbi:hypothetical protein EON09_24815 [Pseudomonas soli]|uniref:Uncharacterized protein n=1 Tax=Pseudomonas soli TaxID=1306993 RepID=A0A2V4LNB3_9PSED|nr:hypothetical protein C3F42_24160 [Pseudomonas sp. PONIH3]MDW9405371.1 hypothetical protein [Pseudomonas soli]PMZ91763.1 hypothetical protein C1X79_20305 [Pseudomonas sp. FW305-42]PNA20317.1 hypothetical protein C1X78_22465 [Pseudomonas sp. MPR-R1B]PNB21481.1 hypothetical protein C1X80_21855 [Pseudomonas sp. DP16D-E2]PNB41008.1 hypothetical protein C1X75_22515 [Pseudomonas sp. FW305-17]PNB56687.1 hypothetical protein C1X77_22825 [Pseudomonas sp. GW531-E2]PNB65774.1 hypothetical protein C1X
MFYEVHEPDSRDPGAGSPENLKTVTRGFLAVPAKRSRGEDHENKGPGSSPAREMQIRFLGAL